MSDWNNGLKEYFKDITTLINCFLVIGFNEKNIDDYFKFGEKLEPTILSQFPTAESCGINVPESIATVIPIQFCFPNGAEIMKDESVASSTYSNILTDEHGDLLYCSILKVFERQTPKLPDVDFTLEIQENLLPLVRNSSSSCTDKSNRSSSPISPAEPSSPLTFIFDDPGEVLVPKALVIISKQPLFQTFQKILSSLYKISKRHLNLPIECYIAHMVLQIPLPPKGHVKIKYLLSNYEFTIWLPPLNKLPVLDLNLGVLFAALDIDNILTLFRNILLEKSTVFVSNSEDKLLTCTYSILSLLFPFHWNMVYVPILPFALIDYLYSPVTFIFGVHTKNLEEIFSRVNDSVCVVDLDNNKFLVSELPSYHRQNSVNLPLPKLPDHYGKKLKKNLGNTLSKIGLAKGKTLKLAKEDLDAKTSEDLRQSFLKFFVSILKDYKKFMIFEKKEGSSLIFNTPGFISACSDKDFMNSLFETQMFSNFCESRIRPKDFSETCEGIFFDEHIVLKENRSISGRGIPVTFVNDTSQDHSETYTIPAIDTFFKSGRKFKYENFQIFDQNALGEFPFPQAKPPKYVENTVKESKVLPNWKTEKECILTSWVDLWGLFLNYQDSSEHSSRIEELLRVCELLERSTNLPTRSVYKSLLERCYNVSPTLALPIFSFMSSSKIAIDAGTLQILQKINLKLTETRKTITIYNTGANFLVTQNNVEPTEQSTLKRMFTKLEETHVFAKQEVSFIIKETCKKCGKILKAEEIAQGWSKTEYKYESSCVSCGEKILPRLSVRVGLEVGFFKDKPTSAGEETLFVSAQALRQMINDLGISHKELDLVHFRAGYPMIFWNSIWYFYQNNLPFEHLLAYDKEEEEAELVLVNEELPLVWDLKTNEKNVQTELSMADIEKAEKKYQKFSELMMKQNFI